jgi:hypothetical protein
MSTFDTSQIESIGRSDLIARAEALGVEKADVLTRAELIDEIVKRSVADPLERRLARGLLGVARDLVARVVERGLHLPDAAALIRGLQQATLTPVTPPIATVTLAEIYAGQGHRDRALAVLDEVLEKEPDHGAARTLRDKVAGLPEADGAIPVEAPSEPPPQPEPLAAPPLVSEDDVQGPLVEADELHAAGQREADEDEREGEPDRVRDTLPPEPDVSPTLAPDDFPSTTLRAAPPDAAAVEATSRLTEIAPPWADEADRLVLLPLDATSALARWEIRPGALEEARARAEGGVPIVRIVAVTPSWGGPGVEVRDIEIGQPTGDWWVSDLPPGAVLRAAVGWRGSGGFDPLAVALDVVAAGENASDASRWASEVTAMDDHGIEVRARQRAGEGRPGEGSASSSWRALAFAPGEASYEASP